MPEKILVVDDEEPIADILEFNLKKDGYQVEVAFDGEAALAKAASFKPDLIILDIMLPKLDGWAVCQRLRQHSTVPIIMLTAKDEETDKVLGLELGADDYVTKPFSPRELWPGCGRCCAAPSPIAATKGTARCSPLATLPWTLPATRLPSGAKTSG